MSAKKKIKYPIGIQWKIAEYILQEKIRSIDGDLDSQSFQIPGTNVKYYVNIDPNGNNEEHRGETWIFLYFGFWGTKKIEAEFIISVETANFSTVKKFVYEKTEGWGILLCTVDELFDPQKRFFVGGEVVINFEGFAKIEMDEKSLKSYCGKDILGIDLWNQDNKDFKISVDGNEVQTHKFVLSARSPVFAAMLKPHTKEAQENQVTINGFSFEIVEAAIKLCYHSSLVDKISIDDAMPLLQFFEKYNIQSLKEDLEKHMISEITEANVCDLINSSIDSNSVNLRTKCTEFLRSCSEKHKPINNFDVLNKEFALNFLKNSFNHISR